MSVRGQFVAKLPMARVAELVSGSKGKHFDTGRGRLLKEWVAISGNREIWPGLAKEACAFVRKISLDAPTRRPLSR